MPFVRVTLVHNNVPYSVEVDSNADPKKLARGLANKLQLPENENYRLKLVDDLNIREGSTIELVRVADNELFRGLKPLDPI